MNNLHNNENQPPPPVRYIAVPSQQEGWLHFRAIHQVSENPISCQTWANLVSQYTVLGSELTQFLRDLDFDGMLFECRGSDGSTPFEFAVGPAPSLDQVREADPDPFSTHLFGAEKDESDGGDFGSWDDTDGDGDADDDNRSESSSENSTDSSDSETANEEVLVGCVFDNLGRDATLVAPRPATVDAARDCRFAHLAAYVKLTPLEEAGELWALVAIEYEFMLATTDKDRLVYLSTNGLGVSFLHFRLEHRPKYYNYQAFSKLPTNAMQDSASLKIQIASDLHTEFYGIKASSAPSFLIVPNAPVLALVGDIGIALTDSLRAFLHQQADRFEHVLFIVGNHEFYNIFSRTRSISEQWQWLRTVCEERDNIHLLEKDTIDIGGIRILGTALWSDIPEDKHHDAKWAMNDYAKCFIHKEGESCRRLHPEDTCEWYHENVEWLRGELDRARQEGIPTLVLTHHTPLVKGTSHSDYDKSPLNCCFSSDLSELLSFPVKVWACGHTHFNFDIDIGGTRLVSNQRGYKGGANSDYRRDGLVLDIEAIL